MYFPRSLNSPSRFSACRKKHVSAILNLRGMTRQSQRQEVLNVVTDAEGAGAARPAPPDRVLFSELPATSEVPCLSLGLSRLALGASSCLSSLRPRRAGGAGRSQENQENQEDQENQGL
ncbi:Exocyst complex component 3-like protein 2 [Liparis tanakae]|uniref:Exocyst complex component 3-like protein 2 n=1 Tax=Liparis tanakae TaxID=230148 RepID=A0A4Z2EU93_9TELE|nr:Exocyst complex component 3-like protein 2 [Liparis tanakae]